MYFGLLNSVFICTEFDGSTLNCQAKEFIGNAVTHANQYLG